MGLFDTLTFESSEKFAQNIDWGKNKVPSQVIVLIKDNNRFQTKSLDNFMMNYLVSVEGYLKSQHFEEYQYVNPDDRPIKMAIEAIRKGEYWMDENFSGRITIIPDIYIDFLDQDWFVEFELSFKDGILEKTTCVDCRTSDNAERKQIQKDFIENLLNKIALRDKLMSNIFIKIYFKIYAAPITRLATKMCIKYPKSKKFIRFFLKTFVPLSKYF